MTRCLDCGSERIADQCPSCGLTSAAAEVMFKRRLLKRTAVFLTGSLLFPYVSQLYPPLDLDVMLVFFGVLIGSIIAMCTLIGLFVGFSSLFVWLIAVYAAQPVVGALIGQWILGRSKETWPLIGRMMLGVFIIRVATLLPHIGWLIKLGVVLWGLGAISLALYRRFQPPAPVQTPYVPPSAPLTPLTPAGGAAAV